ncbi:4010_t:CDS:2 [Cetraspora pellucida]|uniref:4010_t:CDS:1 n=1 Tax=Cetraspora pellucida TaxID=1433469 RepID=A0ACA9K1B4_9GLOM|nr:4010_t:CDS:2 [Cetraspora pellucida]
MSGNDENIELGIFGSSWVNSALDQRLLRLVNSSEFSNDIYICDNVNATIKSAHCESENARVTLKTVKGNNDFSFESFINEHSKNVLINENEAMIYNFSSSMQLDNQYTSLPELKVKPAYTDPQFFLQRNYLLDKRSDVYSLGSILWELISGIPPFSNFSESDVTTKIIQGEREKELLNTPTEYYEIYKECWQADPDIRPRLSQTQDVWTTLNMNHRKEFSDLPNECVLKIFTYLNEVKDLYNCLFINKFIHGIAVYMLWRNPFINNAKWRDSIILTYLNELNIEEQKTLIPLRINFPSIESHSSKYAPCLETLDLHFLHIACLKWLAGAGYFCQCGELRIVQAVVSAIVRMVLRTNRNLKILNMKVAEDEPDVSNASIFSSSQPGISSLHSFHLTLNNTPTKENVSQFLTKLPDLCLSLCEITFDFAETDIDEKITTLLIKLIRVQKALNHFTLKCRGAITGKYIETLESQKDHLMSLHLDRLDFRKISDDSLKVILLCKKLKHITISAFSGITEQHCNVFSYLLPNLETLYISANDSTNDHVAVANLVCGWHSNLELESRPDTIRVFAS